MNTSLYDFGSGFKPAPEFFLEPYILGYSIGLMNTFRAIMLKGKGWSTRKSGEFMFAAFTELQRDSIPLDMDIIMNAMNDSHGNPDFEEGMQHAELNFFAMFDMMKRTYSDPIVDEARKQAERLQKLLSDLSPESNDPNAGFKMAIAQLTVQKRLEELFPEAST